MILTEICPQEDQGCSFSHANQKPNQFTEREEDSDGYSVTSCEVCVALLISST